MWCKKVFIREASYFKHICRQKKRFLEKDTNAARLAFHAYNHFQHLNYASKKAPSYEKFMESSFYDAFMNFAKYIQDVDAITPVEFIDYAVRSKEPIDRWCKDSFYERYVRDLTLKEDPIRAVERNLMLMESWSINTGHSMKDFFRYIETPRATLWIKTGRISPWVMLNCDSGLELLAKLSEEQLLIIKDALNTKLWFGKFTRFRSDVDNIKETLKEVGL